MESLPNNPGNDKGLSSSAYITNRVRFCLFAGGIVIHVTGLPFMVFIRQLNEKLKDAIENIVPSLIDDTRTLVDEKAWS